MLVYLDAVMVLNFLVDLLLILGTNRLTGHPPAYRRALCAAVLGSAYAGAVMVPGFRFLGNSIWRIIFWGLISVTAFGVDRSAVQRGAVFILLSMALGGIASGTKTHHFGALCICALLLWLLCRVGFQGNIGQRSYVDAQLSYGDRTVKLLALRDTGNTLRDPLTGEPVLVCGADVGEELLGVKQSCFSDPAATLASGMIPGLRLIPYRAVGQPGSMMLGVRLKNARINGKIMNPLVAFAPQEIGKGECYRMLTGGLL